MEQHDEQKAVEFDPARFFESFIAVGKELLVRPKKFFGQLPLTGDLKNPLLFLTICAFLSALFMANVRKADYNLFFILFFANTGSAFIGSFVLHTIIAKIFKSNAPFQATFRIVAYASLTDVASWIPVLGPIAYFYGLYLIFLGLQEIHHLSPRQSGAAVITIVVIISLLVAGLLIMSPETLQEAVRFADPENQGF